ncbi:hypothetical protein HJB78_24290 [Rhizobium lentis]|uniref:hypothetical protein n=1 Tax=Rhizobium lentis TaxID=1138194 RepID=UPI001C83A469|nr:hypothetical protein [Rhizobium lentis]MBX5154063.1 hypothetical protein [Rhizobium lentis]
MHYRQRKELLNAHTGDEANKQRGDHQRQSLNRRKRLPFEWNFTFVPPPVA